MINLIGTIFKKNYFRISDGVKWMQLKALTEFMYRGEINVAHDQLAPLLKVNPIKEFFYFNVSCFTNNPAYINEFSCWHNFFVSASKT